MHSLVCTLSDTLTFLQLQLICNFYHNFQTSLCNQHSPPPVFWYTAGFCHLLVYINIKWSLILFDNMWHYLIICWHHSVRYILSHWTLLSFHHCVSICDQTNSLYWARHCLQLEDCNVQGRLLIWQAKRVIDGAYPLSKEPHLVPSLLYQM